MRPTRTWAQAIEALDALGDRELGREVVGLLDTEVRAGSEATDEALRSLGDDPDPWIRALALRAIGDRMTASYRELVDDAANDPDPIVRATAATMPLIGGRPVTETARTLDELERMVVLRRVPLFSELDPEDLQRIAVCSGALYPAGEPLVREGDVGDELIVIVTGTVTISKRDGDLERFVRTYEAGDHIGELAVLRDRPPRHGDRRRRRARPVHRRRGAAGDPPGAPGGRDGDARHPGGAHQLPVTDRPRDPLANTSRLIVDGSNLLHALSRGEQPQPQAALIGRLRAIIPAGTAIELVFDGPPERGSVASASRPACACAIPAPAAPTR